MDGETSIDMLTCILRSFGRFCSTHIIVGVRHTHPSGWFSGDPSNSTARVEFAMLAAMTASAIAASVTRVPSPPTKKPPLHWRGYRKEAHQQNDGLNLIGLSGSQLLKTHQNHCGASSILEVLLLNLPQPRSNLRHRLLNLLFEFAELVLAISQK